MQVKALVRRCLTLAAILGACAKMPVPAGPGGGGGGGGGTDSTGGGDGGGGGFLGFDSIKVDGNKLQVQTGFTMGIFADDLHAVRFLAVGPQGAIYASLSDDGKIIRLRDVDGDGVADSSQTILSGLDYPFGIAFRGDTMYFAEETQIRRLDPGSKNPVWLFSISPTGGHSTRTIAFGPDNRLYVAVGSVCNVCQNPLPRAAVTSYALDGSDPHTFATGLRNSVGIAFNPTTGELWANNNERDDIGPNQATTDSLPPEKLNILKDGKWYGFPQCYLPGKANPEFKDADCSSVEPPALTFTAHSAPLGLVFYQGTMFPPQFRGDAFMTYHGSWNRSKPTGAKLVRVRVQGGRPIGLEDMVSGWQRGNSRWGRPVSLVVATDGALLISDDARNVIWRLAYGSPPVGNKKGRH